MLHAWPVLPFCVENLPYMGSSDIKQKKSRTRNILVLSTTKELKAPKTQTKVMVLDVMWYHTSEPLDDVVNDDPWGTLTIHVNIFLMHRPDGHETIRNVV